MEIVPASLILAGSLATRAGSTVGALAEAVDEAELELLCDSESDPQAVRASAVVATAATASARVRNMGVLSRGCDGAGAAPARCEGNPATGARDVRHTPATIPLCDDAHPRATPACSERPGRTPSASHLLGPGLVPAGRPTPL